MICFRCDRHNDTAAEDGRYWCSWCNDWADTIEKEHLMRVLTEPVKQMIRDLEGDDLTVATPAAKALGQTNNFHAVEPLIAVLEAKKRWGSVRREAATSLGALKDSRAIEPLKEAVLDVQWDISKAASEALAGFPDIIADLLPALSHRNFQERKVAATVLGKLGDERAVEPLLQRLQEKNEHPDVQFAAALALGSIGDPRAVEPLIAALTDGSSDVRGAAAVALGRLKDERAVEPLAAVLLNDNVWGIRARAAGALSDIGGVEAIAPLVAALQDEHHSVRADADTALHRLLSHAEVENLKSEKNHGVSESRTTLRERFKAEILSFLTSPRTKNREQQTGDWWSQDNLKLVVVKTFSQDVEADLLFQEAEAAIDELVKDGQITGTPSGYRAS